MNGVERQRGSTAVRKYIASEKSHFARDVFVKLTRKNKKKGKIGKERGN